MSFSKCMANFLKKKNTSSSSTIHIKIWWEGIYGTSQIKRKKILSSWLNCWKINLTLANNNNGNTSTLIIFYRNLSHLHTKGLKNWVFCFFFCLFRYTRTHTEMSPFFLYSKQPNRTEITGSSYFFLLFIHTITIANNFIRFSIKKIDHPFFSFWYFFSSILPEFLNEDDETKDSSFYRNSKNTKHMDRT